MAQIQNTYRQERTTNAPEGFTSLRRSSRSFERDHHYQARDLSGNNQHWARQVSQIDKNDISYRFVEARRHSEYHKYS
jgi:hypothetical protein